MSASAKYDKRLRSCTDPETILGTNLDMGEVPAYRTRLFHLFEMIEKEFDALHVENCGLRAKVAALSGENAETVTITTQENAVTVDTPKGRKASAMMMGQKLRTALRGPPSRLVGGFKVGGDGSRFRLHKQFEGHRDGVWHVTADPTRTMCATSSSDQTAKVFNVDSGQCLATYSGHSGSVNCVAFAPTETSPHETTLATASGDESAHIWKIAMDDKENHDDDYSPTEGHRVRTPMMRLTGHTGPVIACDWMSGGNHLVTASWDRSANIFDVNKGKVVSILSGHEQELNHCSSHLNQRLVVTSSKDSTFRLWDFRETIQSVAVFQGHQDSVTSVAFSTGDRIVSGSDDRTVKVWDLRNMRNALSSIRLSSSVNRLSVSKAHNLIAIPLDNRHVRIYDLNGNRLPRIPNRRCHTRLVTACAWIDDHPHSNLLTAGFDRCVYGWKVSRD